jgi:formylglycine-generating enzyme required for sulfatase activity/serine/threonine protein kinase
MPTDVERVQTVFLSAAEISDLANRARFLDGACAGDTELRFRVEALLRAHEQPDSLLDRPAVAPPAPAPGPTNTIGYERGAGTADEVSLGFLAPTTRADSLGRIGHYEVLQVLGQGGFGIVFRAFDDVLQRVVAVKVLTPQLAATSPARKRFLREARSSAQVRHEHVVQVYEVGEQPLPYIAMEFIPGETLQQRVDRVGPVEPAEVVRVGRQIAEGLAAAHATDLIHRDIKPGNILLEGGAQRVKITDFGLARAADDASISQSGIIAGTPMYMAPEQAQGEKLDQRADLFSLGSVLYQMAAGRPPFRASGTLAVLKRVAEDTPRPIREIIPETPQWLCDIIAKLHAKKPEDRFHSARAVADLLADCEARLEVGSKLKDFSRIPGGKPASSGKSKWFAAAVLLLPVLALAVMELAGMTHLFQGQHGTSDTGKSRIDPQTRAGAEFKGWPADAPLLAITPFDAAQARAHQEAWAKYLGVPVEFTNGIGMKFVIIPPGKFTMGSSPAEITRSLGLIPSGGWQEGCISSEGPEHEVEITRPVYMGETEVTVGQFRLFAEDPKADVGDSRWANPGFEQTDLHPVVYVSWRNAVDFCNWLSEKESKQYRLPSEAEWEYSCRAGTKSPYSFGENEEEDMSKHAWVGSRWGKSNDTDPGPQPVKQLNSNPWQLRDMHGNVAEWCTDHYDPNYYRESPKQDPSGPTTGVHGRVIRSGAWNFEPVGCRSAFRNRNSLSFRDSNVGFRVVLVVSPPASVGTNSGTGN